MHNIGDHNQVFALAVESVVQIYINGSFTLAGVLILLVVLQVVCRGLLLDPSNRIDFKPLFRALAVIFVIYFYSDIMSAVSSGIAMFTAQFSTDQDIVQKLVELSEARSLAEPAESDAQNLTEKITGYLTGAFDITAILAGALERGFSLIVREIILTLRTIILGFLFLAGPIALAFSLIPQFESLATRWFQGWLAVQCWAITLTILDNLVDAYQFDTDDSTLRFIINNLVVAIMYVLVPYLTSYFIASTSSGTFLSKVVGTAALVIAGGKRATSMGRKGNGQVFLAAPPTVGNAPTASKAPTEAPSTGQRNNSINVKSAQ